MRNTFEKRARVLCFGGAALFLCACGAGPAGGDEKRSREAVFETTIELQNADGKRVESFGREEKINLVVTIRNRSDSNQTLTFPTAQTHDCTVSTPDGEPIWNWSKGRMFAQVLTELTLKAGEEKRYVQAWDQICDDGTAAKPGRYTAVGSITATAPGAKSTPLTFSIR